MVIIEANKISKVFNGATAVDKVEFKVDKGEIFGFLGPNGAGKTTTINILCTLLKPTQGVAILNGFDVVKEPDRVRASIGIVFQDPSLDERLTAWENLNFHALIYNISKELRKERIQQVLEMIELWPRRNDIVRTFSGGMKRRLEIGRGLLHFPKVLFLDEPTLGLDPQTRNYIWDYIHQLKRREKITIFMTTHYMEEAENCDRIAIIDHGKIIALDTPAKLKNLVGGDVITLTTNDNKAAAKEISGRYGLEVQTETGHLVFEIANGEKFLPEFIGRMQEPVTSISVRRPTLEDVFLKLTGRKIREESGSAMEGMRAKMRAMRRR